MNDGKIKEFEEWLKSKQYSNVTVQKLVRCIKTILRKYGFVTEEEFEEVIWNNYSYKRAGRQMYRHAYRTFLQFLRETRQEMDKLDYLVIFYLIVGIIILIIEEGWV